jgi:hypothetical protein
VRRRVGRVSVDLHVLDLTDKTTRSHLGGGAGIYLSMAGLR